MRNCYKVEVITTNGLKDTTKNPDGGYVKCHDGELFVIAERPSDIEKVIEPGFIKSITRFGFGVAVGQN